MKKPGLVPTLLCLVWFGAVIKGMTILWDYQDTAGKNGVSPVQWPRASRVARSTDHPMLVMAVHPHCPCSRASLDELAILMTQLHGHLSACVLFYKPSGFDDKWVQTDLWKSAALLPDVRVLRDDDGREARIFGALTSGQTIVYDKTGRLMFSGGITAARGHSGDNAGFRSILSSVRQGIPGLLHSPVYGCSLETPSQGTSWKR